MIEPTKHNAVTVLVVDDSAFMRKVLQSLLNEDPRLQVVGAARNGAEALDLTRQFDPDVVTLDVEMPVMDGLAALRAIMAERPRPVLMLSSLTTEAAATTLEALSVGAADFIAKPGGSISLGIGQIAEEIREKVYRVGRRRARRRLATDPPPPPPPPPPPMAARPRRIGKHQAVVIGSSTGGPSALETLLRQVPADFPLPILIVQHMPRLFTESLAERLDRLCPMRTRLATEGMTVEPRTIYVAHGGKHLTVRRVRQEVQCHLAEEPANKPHRPSVDVLFESAATVWGPYALGVVLTGMGNDGQAGATQIVARGGSVIAQDEQSCVVYGMPRAVVEAELACFVGDLNALAHCLNQYCYTPTGVTA